MIGPDQLQTFLMIHFEANLRRLVRDRPAILYWVLDPDRLGTFIAHDIDRTWVFMHRFDPATEPAATFTPEMAEAIVRRAIGRDDVELAIRDMSPWTMTAQVADANHRHADWSHGLCHSITRPPPHVRRRRFPPRSPPE